MDDLAKKIDLDIIRYANCWEDADILLEGLAPVAGSKILSIGSAGDNSFSLLATNPGMVVAVDINATQLHLIELKKAAIKQLDRQQVLQFLGFTECGDRLGIFNQVKAGLSSEALRYWEANLAVINAGVIYSGKFEKYFQLFVHRVLPWIHDKNTVVKMFEPRSAAGQEAFYANIWNNWRWKLLFRIFFSKYVMGKYGRDPEFMKEVEVSVSRTIYNKAAAQLRSAAARQNFILHFSLLGNFGTLLPHYLREENFDTIKTNIDRLLIKQGYAQQAIDQYGKFNAMNLSNIFEYMDGQTFAAVAGALLDGMEKNGKLAYWNLMVPRRISQIFPERASYQSGLSAHLTKIDKGFFYNQFIIDTVK